MARSALSKPLGALAVALLLLSTVLCQAARFEYVRAERAATPAKLSDNQTRIPTNRLALVVGNYSYPDSDVPPVQVRRDAEALAHILQGRLHGRPCRECDSR
jgi:hypothetical protein